ncbi:MAG TPA: glycoside hydrolase family 2, partial [Telluria sp.]
VLTEFGGIAFDKSKAKEAGTWGYSRAHSEEEFSELYSKLLKVVNETFMFSGFCYTQFADTFQEANGLLYADRTPKIPIEEISAATRGTRIDVTRI